MKLGKKELLLIAESQPSGCDIKIQKNDSGRWQVGLVLNRQKDIHFIHTARGEIKTWRYMEDVILFVQETMPTAKKVELEVGPWKLVKNK